MINEEVDSRNLSIKFMHFKKRKLSDFLLMQTFNLTLLSDKELDGLTSKTS